MSAIVQVEKITSSLSPNGFYEKVNEVIDQNNNVHDLVQEAEEVIERVDKVIPSDASEYNKLTSRAYVDAKFVAEGVTDAERTKWNAYTTNKQDTLTQAQLDAVNSGITLSKVAQYDDYATGKADASYSYSKNDTDYKINAAIDTCKAYTYSKDQTESAIASAITTAKTTLEPKLTWDWNPTSASKHAVYSGGVYEAIQNVKASASSTYQTKLTFDSAPVANSSNPVTSGGLYTTIENVKSKIYDRTINGECYSAFMPASAIKIWTSIDSGTTWTEADYTDEDKEKLFSMNKSGPIYVGPKGTETAVGQMTRIEVTPPITGGPPPEKSCGGSYYCTIDRCWAWVSTSNHAFTLTISASTFGAPDTFTTLLEETRMGGWSGPNMMQLPSRGAFGGYSVDYPYQGSNHIYTLRFDFKVTSAMLNREPASYWDSYKTSHPWIGDIRLFGSSCWGSNNNMFRFGHLYQWDVDQNMTLPNGIDAQGNIDAASYTVNGKPLGSGNRTPGEIVTVIGCDSFTPEGCVACNGAEYSRAQYTDFYDNYLVTGKLKTCLYDDYDNQVSTYGNCSMWGYDSTNKKFKVPTIKDGTFLEQDRSGSLIGKSYLAGIPNITGYLISNDGEYAYSPYAKGYKGEDKNTYAKGALYVADKSKAGCSSVSGLEASNQDREDGALAFDASRSDGTYGKSTTVQPLATTVRYFVCLANASANESSMDWSAWQTAMDGKQNTLISGTNIKTINGTSILGGGNIESSSWSSSETFTGSTQSTAPGAYPRYGYGHISTGAGITAGTYTLKDLLQQLVNKSHSHSGSCDCDCDCDGGE